MLSRWERKKARKKGKSDNMKRSKKEGGRQRSEGGKGEGELEVEGSGVEVRET